MADEEHKLNDGSLGGHVSRTDDACLAELVARFVDAHLDRTSKTLRHVDNDDASLDGIVECMQEPFVGHGIACSVGFEDYAS